MMNALKFYFPDKTKTIVKKLFSTVLVSNKINSQSLNQPFFCVVIPGSLHIVKLCLSFIPKNQECILVLNGLDKWEIEWIKQHLKVKGLIIFPYMIQHGIVINYLVNWMKKPFGLIDYDCFVFCQDYFEKIKLISNRTLLSSYFCFNNENLDLVFPETFFLYVNTLAIKRLQKQFKITPKKYAWNEIPVSVQTKMETIGISKTNLPEGYKEIFDTLRALMVLGLTEGYQFNFPKGYIDNYLLTKEMGNIFHVGAVSNANLRTNFLTMSKTRGSYFWHKTLENEDDKELQNKYCSITGNINAEAILDKLPNSREIIGKEFFEAVDRIINHESCT